MYTKSEFPTPLEMHLPSGRQEEHIHMDVTETGCGDVKWTELAQDVQQQTLQVTVQSHRGSKIYSVNHTQTQMVHTVTTVL
jgi:hypothetical protein